MKTLKRVLAIIAFGAVGAGVGWGLMNFLLAYLPDGGMGAYFILLGAAVPIFYLHIIVHEAGHLLGGRLSGYTFVSFRVGNIMIARENGKLVRKKHTVAGTAGQCLLSPPDMVDGKFPLVLYNAGGGVMNLLLGAASFGLFVLLSGLLSVGFLVSAVIGLFMALFNLIPLRLGMVPNDGYNMLLMGREENAAARRAFWVLLRANGMFTNGTRPRDLPTEWLDWIESGPLDDPMVASATTLQYAYLLDKGDTAEARARMQFLLDNATLTGVHKNELLCELLFLELIRECRPPEIEKLYTKELQDYIKLTATYASRQRLLYGYHRLFTKDTTAAERHLALFQKACKTSTSLGEVPGEQELIALVDEITCPL